MNALAYLSVVLVIMNKALLNCLFYKDIIPFAYPAGANALVYLGTTSVAKKKVF